MNATPMPPRLDKIWRGIASGQPGKIVAVQCGLSYESFKVYRQDLYKRLGVHSNVEATLKLLNSSNSPQRES